VGLKEMGRNGRFSPILSYKEIDERIPGRTGCFTLLGRVILFSVNHLRFELIII